MNRRGFLTGIVSAGVCAPAIVKEVMKIKVYDKASLWRIVWGIEPYGISPGMQAMIDIRKLQEEIRRKFYDDLFRIIAQENEIMKDMPYDRIHRRIVARNNHPAVWRPVPSSPSSRLDEMGPS